MRALSSPEGSAATRLPAALPFRGQRKRNRVPDCGHRHPSPTDRLPERHREPPTTSLPCSHPPDRACDDKPTTPRRRKRRSAHRPRAHTRCPSGTGSADLPIGRRRAQGPRRRQRVAATRWRRSGSDAWDSPVSLRFMLPVTRTLGRERSTADQSVMGVSSSKRSGNPFVQRARLQPTQDFPPKGVGTLARNKHFTS